MDIVSEQEFGCNSQRVCQAERPLVCPLAGMKQSRHKTVHKQCIITSNCQLYCHLILGGCLIGVQLSLIGMQRTHNCRMPSLQRFIAQ